jgi:hypothetical protein
MANFQSLWAQQMSNLGDFMSKMILANQQKQEQEEQKKQQMGYLTDFAKSLQPQTTWNPVGLQAPQGEQFNIPDFSGSGLNFQTPNLMGLQRETTQPNLMSPEVMKNIGGYLGAGGESGMLNFIANMAKDSNKQDDMKVFGGAETGYYGLKGNKAIPLVAGRGEKPDLPEGFAQLTSPEKKAEVWNKTYGTNYTAKDFENLQERPYTTVVKTPQGYKGFNTRTGRFEDVKDAPSHLMPLSEEAVKEISDIKTTYERLGDVAVNAEKLKDKFGFVEGRWNNLKVKFVNDGPTQEVINELKSMITIAYSLSGKQISYREMELLEEAILPRLEQPYENFKATLNYAQKWLSKTHNNRLDYWEKAGYGGTLDKIGNKQQDPKIQKLKDKYGLE